MRVFVMHCKVGELTNLLHENKYFIESLVKQYQKKELYTISEMIPTNVTPTGFGFAVAQH